MLNLVSPLVCIVPMIEFADVHFLPCVGILRTHANFTKTRSIRMIDEELRGMHTGTVPYRRKRMEFLHRLKDKINFEPDVATNILCKYSKKKAEERIQEAPVYYITIGDNHFLDRIFLEDHAEDVWVYDGEEELWESYYRWYHRNRAS